MRSSDEGIARCVPQHRGAIVAVVLTYLVECYWPGVTPDAVSEAGGRLGEVTRQLADTGHRVRYLGTLLIADDEVVFCRVGADTRDEVEEAIVRAGLRFDRILEYREWS